MTPSQAAQNLREWAAAYLDPEPSAMHDFYTSQKDYTLSDSLQQLFLILTGTPGKPTGFGVNVLTAHNWFSLCLSEKDPEHYCLFLCFLAAVIETDGTDWIQNA